MPVAGFATEIDPQRARAIARGPVGFLGQVPAYQAHFRRMGFEDDEIAQLGDRLLDAVVVWGDVDAVAARVAEHRAAGADHVAISVVTASPDVQPVDVLRDLAVATLGQTSS